MPHKPVPNSITVRVRARAPLGSDGSGATGGLSRTYIGHLYGRGEDRANFDPMLIRDDDSGVYYARIKFTGLIFLRSLETKAAKNRKDPLTREIEGDPGTSS